MTIWGDKNTPFWSAFDDDKYSIVHILPEIIMNRRVLENFVEHYKEEFVELYNKCEEHFPEIIEEFNET